MSVLEYFHNITRKWRNGGFLTGQVGEDLKFFVIYEHEKIGQIAMGNNRSLTDARLVVAGLDEHGKSAILIDKNADSKLATPAYTTINLWQIDNMPPGIDEIGIPSGTVSLLPPVGSALYRIVTFPPDSAIGPEAYKNSLELFGDENALVSEANDIAGLHQTDSIDIVTVISGEVYAVLETTETLLRSGETFIQRGGKHSWSNRGKEDVSCVVVVIPVSKL
ncbi:MULTISPECIES: cupin domain-containing protein [unclassified Rhodococcus (in: high G+C Gram-positive bacteria)]|uniref:cupin domain-containing protein n=1 Tax=unclassified Rhodococcus (in: high G+C Gram-positive bacteria) TaxID=192944 RepID=UPI001141967E|nr:MULTISPECIES: cupin domain-containing protein [unclassified Rhodococcus (in: high G+C Gram-positive bacteria)]TQC35961.1 cupin domain-containing protein [Rhodococcus sp. WS7]